MTVKPKYYFNLDGNITDGEKEYSLYNIEDVVGGLSISSDLKERYVLYGRNSLLDLLNEQHETIQKLNQQLRIFSDGLKAEIRETKEVFEDYSECVDEKKQLKKENEQLQHYKEAYGTEIVKIKQTIKDMIESERTELGKMTLRQLWRQIQ